jgi:transcriptional regulator with XRE-family HTH domain
MGRFPRRRQERLHEKLLEIRLSLNLSQNEMLNRLGLQDELFRSNISSYELGEREPPLYVLLRYAQVGGVCMDALVDDEVDLPANLPAEPRHKSIRSNKASKGTKRR